MYDYRLKSIDQYKNIQGIVYIDLYYMYTAYITIQCS